ncbi:MAG: Mur ligase family protein [Christensenellales bacterium]
MQFFDFYNINFYIILIISLICACLTSLLLYKPFTALQLDEYKNKGYFEYLKDSFSLFLSKIILITCISITFSVFLTLILQVLSINSLFSFISIFAFLYLTFDFIEKQKNEEQKIKLKFTKRFLRLFILNFIFNLIIIFILTTISVYYIDFLKYGICTLSILIALIILPFCNLLLKPIERLIKFRFKCKAKRKLKQYPNLIKIGITGSFGKTSTKFILSKILSTKYNICTSPKSYNTPMGLTKTILNDLQPYHDIFIAEMGANVKNDIKELCNLISPQIAIITAVGNQHLKTFKNMQNLISTKYQLIESVEKTGGLAIFNNDNDIVLDFYKKANCNKISTSTQAFNTDICALDINYTKNGSTFTLITPLGKINCKTKLLGKHNIQNILLAVGVAIKLNVPLKDIAKAINSLEPIKHRLNLIKKDNYYILDDSFNSNSVGASNALDVLSCFNGKKIVITPGIVELGKDSYETNLNFARKIAKVANICIIVNKTNFHALNDGIDNKIKVYDALNFSNAMNIVKYEIEKDACILIENDLPDNYV